MLGQVSPTGMMDTSAPQRAVRVTVIVCAVAAAAAAIGATVAGHPLEGIAVALGLVLAAINAVVAQWLLRLGAAFAATSLARLMALTGLALVSGLALGWPRVVLVAAGIAAGLLVLSGASIREVLRAR